MEKGWLKPILEQASADRENWPAWQRGSETEGRADQRQVHESAASPTQEPEGHKTAA
jgi:hypothetical protein